MSWSSVKRNVGRCCQRLFFRGDWSPHPCWEPISPGTPGIHRVCTKPGAGPGRTGCPNQDAPRRPWSLNRCLARVPSVVLPYRRRVESIKSRRRSGKPLFADSLFFAEALRFLFDWGRIFFAERNPKKGYTKTRMSKTDTSKRETRRKGTRRFSFDDVAGRIGLDPWRAEVVPGGLRACRREG